MLWLTLYDLEEYRTMTLRDGPTVFWFWPKCMRGPDANVDRYE